MSYQGGDTEGLQRLSREFQLAGAGMARSRVAIERTMNQVCMATTVPADLRRIEAWIDETSALVEKAVAALQEPSRPPPASPGTVSGFPNGVEGDCGKMEAGIGATVDVLVGRLHDLRADVNNLRKLQPSGADSFGGHIKQAEGRQRQVDKQLRTWKSIGGCPGSLTIDVARAYVELDIRADLGWTVAAVEAAQVAAADSDHDWWDVDIDLRPLAKVGKAAAVAAAVVAAAAAAAANSVSSGGAGIA